MAIAVNIHIEANSPEELASLKKAVVSALTDGGQIVAETAPDQLVTLPPEEKPTPPKKRTTKGRARKPETVVEEPTPAATANTTPQDMRNEAARLLAGKFGTKATADLKKLLKKFGVPAVPDVPDDQAAEFLAETKALCSDAAVELPEVPQDAEVPAVTDAEPQEELF